MRANQCSLLVLLFLFDLAWATSDPIGTVRTFRPEASIIRNGVEMPTNLGSVVHAGDRLVTEHDGAIGIVFDDGSILSLGPLSEYVIEGFHFHPAEKDVSFLSLIKRGTVTFLSGAINRISPGSVKIKTPTATLGLRGTKVLIEVR
jgi:hypothetical protein